jgi:hypothetical protein
MIAKCQKDTGTDLSLPFDQKKVLIFIDWLVRVRNLKGSTVNSYLAGARQLHLTLGLEPPNFRTGLVKLVIGNIGHTRRSATPRPKGLVWRHRSIHSGDPDMICLAWQWIRGLASAWCQYSRLNELQVLFGLHPSAVHVCSCMVYLVMLHMHWGEPCRKLICRCSK